MINRQLLREVMHQKLVELGYSNMEAKQIVDRELLSTIFNMLNVIDVTINKHKKEIE